MWWSQQVHEIRLMVCHLSGPHSRRSTLSTCLMEARKDSSYRNYQASKEGYTRRMYRSSALYNHSFRVAQQGGNKTWCQGITSKLTQLKLPWCKEAFETKWCSLWLFAKETSSKIVLNRCATLSNSDSKMLPLINSLRIGIARLLNPLLVLVVQMISSDYRLSYHRRMVRRQPLHQLLEKMAMVTMIAIKNSK